MGLPLPLVLLLLPPNSDDSFAAGEASQGCGWGPVVLVVVDAHLALLRGLNACGHVSCMRASASLAVSRMAGSILSNPARRDRALWLNPCQGPQGDSTMSLSRNLTKSGSEASARFQGKSYAVRAVSSENRRIPQAQTSAFLRHGLVVRLSDIL